MGIACKLFGHKWNGCKCSKCSETRNESHTWGKTNGGIAHCSVCGDNAIDINFFNAEEKQFLSSAFQSYSSILTGGDGNFNHIAAKHLQLLSLQIGMSKEDPSLIYFNNYSTFLMAIDMVLPKLKDSENLSENAKCISILDKAKSIKKRLN